MGHTDLFEHMAALESDLRGQIDVLKLEAEHWRLKYLKAEEERKDLLKQMTPPHMPGHYFLPLVWSYLDREVAVAVEHGTDSWSAAFVNGCDITELVIALPRITRDRLSDEVEDAVDANRRGLSADMKEWIGSMA